MAKWCRKENSNSSVTCSICIITCGLSNRSIDCRLEYSSFIMPELPPFPLPPSIGHCCEITECGGGESSMQWHWLSWHCAEATMMDDDDVCVCDKEEKRRTCEEYTWIERKSQSYRKKRCSIWWSTKIWLICIATCEAKTWNYRSARERTPVTIAMIVYDSIKISNGSRDLHNSFVSTLTWWTTAATTPTRAVACWCRWFTLWHCVDWHYRALCITPWWSTAIHCCCTPIAPRHLHTFFSRAHACFTCVRFRRDRWGRPELYISY